MINEKEIMPFNFFKYGGIYTGGHNGKIGRAHV